MYMNGENRSRSRLTTICVAFLSLLWIDPSVGFLPSISPSGRASSHALPTTGTTATPRSLQCRRFSSSTALNVWWFGGTEQSEVNGSDDSCELVAVRIERTSANSRRIAGEISVPATLEEVWSILTDYNRLSIHVPNLMESKVVQKQSRGEAGDGSFRCRLFQKGAQKIIGFDFSASVTMDMTEKVMSPNQRKIGFKCVDSQFFDTFDGDWVVKEQIGPDGEVETVCSYSVDVRPKGPVPVAALEWRIREDVPTNLRAVKASSLRIVQPRNINTPALAQSFAASGTRKPAIAGSTSRLVPMMMDWDRDETMAKYL